MLLAELRQRDPHVAGGRLGCRSRSLSSRGAVAAATLGTAAEKMAVIMARPISAEAGRAPRRIRRSVRAFSVA